MAADRELTVSTLLAGAGIGALLAVGNVYLGLRTGFWDPGGITAALLGFALLSRGGGFTPRNNVLVATAMSLSSTPSVMGLLGAVPALQLLGAPPTSLTLILWALALGGLGILVAVPLRRSLIERDNLPFPSARATAEVITAAHAQGSDARRRAAVLVTGAAAAGALTWLRDGVPRWIPQAAIPSFAFAQRGGLGLALSPMFIGCGALVGLRTSLEMLLGAALAWIGFAARLGDVDLGGWLLWPGVGLIVGGGVLGLAFEWRTFASLRSDLRGLSPLTAFAVVAGAGGAVVAVAVAGFHTSLAVAVVGLVVTLPLAAVFLRVAGKTDVAHFAALGQVTQGFLGATTTATAAANVVGGSIAAGSGPQTLQLLYSYKIATQCGGRPRSLVWASIVGLVVGAFLSAGAYAILDRAYHVGSAALPAPFAAPWKAMAVVATEGLSALPPAAGLAAAVALAAGAVLALAGRVHALRWLPSPLSLGLGFIVPFSITATLALGAALGAALTARAPRWSERNLAAAAGGTIAGEAVIAMVAAVLIALGLLKG